MSDTVELRDYEFAEGYAETMLNAYIATQIKVLREQQDMKQTELASLMGTTQTAISRIENVNYSSWSIRTLKKIARALKVRLKVSFESFGTLPGEVDSFSRENLERTRHDEDLLIWGAGKDRVPTRPSSTDEVAASLALRQGTHEHALLLPRKPPATELPRIVPVDTATSASTTLGTQG